MLADTFAGLIKKRVSANGSSLLLQKKDGMSWKQITWKDFESDVKSVAAFAVDAGFEAGDKAFFESCGTYEGLVAESAVLMLGGVASSLPSGEGRFPASKIAFASDCDSALRIAGHKGAEKTVFYSEARGAKPDGAVADFRAALKFGFLKSRKMTDLLEKMFSSVRPDSAAVETRGGNGSAYVLSQKQFLEMLEKGLGRTAGFLHGRSQTFCHLPRADMFSRAVKFLPLCVSARAAAARSEADFFDDILEIMPTVVFLDSRRLEEIAFSFGKNGGNNCKSAFGGRLGGILTDRIPGGDTAEFYSKLGIEMSEVFR